MGALGVLRLVSEQGYPKALGRFVPEGFELAGLDENDLVTLFLDRYAPSPILSPWNNASGFYRSSKGREATAALEWIRDASDPRFARLARAAAAIRGIVEERGYEEAPGDEDKAAFIAALRCVLDDDAIAWIDAVSVPLVGDVIMMPLLGSGGNEGVLEYSGLYLRCLTRVLDPKERAASLSLLRAALFDEPTTLLIESPGGQFTPGTAGGFNTGPGFEHKGLPNNPWSFILTVEGGVVWAGSVGRRQCDTGYRFGVSPFTVRHRAAGHASASSTEDDAQKVRAEVWTPVWTRPIGIGELLAFLREGRIELRTGGGAPRVVRDSVDVVEAISTLGVDRGVSRFVRYALIKRRGDSFVALPANTLEVGLRREADLLPEIDRVMDQLSSFVRLFPGDGPPAQLVRLRDGIDDARFELAARGGEHAVLGLLRRAGALERFLARRDPGKKPALRRPLGGLAPEWFDRCPSIPEVRLAACFGSITRTGDIPPIRAYVAPVDPSKPWEYARASRTVAWAGTDLADRLAAVLQRRMLDASRSESERNPTWSVRRALLGDVAAFIAGATDDRLLEDLLFASTWIDWSRSDRAIAVPRDRDVLPRAYALFALLLLPEGLPNGSERVIIRPEPQILPLLRVGRIGDAAAIAARRLRSSGFEPRTAVPPGMRDAELGRRIAGSLLFHTGAAVDLARMALLPNDFDSKGDVP
jgi:CRISPR-associated protein Csx17